MFFAVPDANCLHEHRTQADAGEVLEQEEIVPTRPVCRGGKLHPRFSLASIRRKVVE